MERVFTARMSALGEAIDFVEAFCTDHGIERDTALRLALVVEELFTNTVTYGHGGGAEAPVRVELGLADAGVTLCYEDRAAPFDPLAAPARALDEPDAPRAPGGFGIELVRQMSASIRYAREDGCNRLWIVLARAD